MRPGVSIRQRVAEFEADAKNKERQSAYTDEPLPNSAHEVAWFYVAQHLMAQRLSATMHVRPDRATRRRMEQAAPKTDPLVKIVTLRRLTEKRERQGPGRDVEWTCQWEVEGHWRHLPDKKIWISDFTKGPPDKPF